MPSKAAADASACGTKAGPEADAGREARRLSGTLADEP